LVSFQGSGSSSGETATFLVTGTSLYPCGLSLSIFRDDPSLITASRIDVSVADDQTAAVVIPNSALVESGEYYGYLEYGPGFKFQTEAVALYGGVIYTPPSENKANMVGLIVGVVIAAVAVVALILVIIIFLVWRHNEIKKRSTESRAEMVGSGGVQFVFYFEYFFLFLLYVFIL
jgi:uncharacterized membrane protein